MKWTPQNTITSPSAPPPLGRGRASRPRSRPRPAPPAPGSCARGRPPCARRRAAHLLLPCVRSIDAVMTATGCTSRETSSPSTEWVRAPTETRRRRSRRGADGVESCRPRPRAGRGPRERADGLAQVGRRPCCRGGSCQRRPRGPRRAGRGSSPRPRPSGPGGRRRPRVAGGDPPARDVVVLDEDPVVEADAGGWCRRRPDRALLSASQAGSGLSGVEDPAPVPRDRLDVLRVGVATPESRWTKFSAVRSAPRKGQVALPAVRATVEGRRLDQVALGCEGASISASGSSKPHAREEPRPARR